MGRFQSYIELSQRLGGGFASEAEPYFEDMVGTLIMADIGLTLHEYLSAAILSSAVAFVLSVPLISMSMALVTGTASGAVAGLIMGFFVGIFLSVAVFMGFYFYPHIRVGQRRANIDNNLPFATMYLSTIAGTGTPPAALFSLLGEFKEYGEVSEEAEKISRDIYTFGAGTTEAIRGAARRTPSEKFKGLLWGMDSIITTGGDLREFLRQKSESFMADYRRSLDEFTDTLNILVEMYITLVIVGSVFLIIISTIMGALGGNSSLIISLQVFTVLFLIPFAAVMFVVIVKGVSPLE